MSTALWWIVYRVVFFDIGKIFSTHTHIYNSHIQIKRASVFRQSISFYGKILVIYSTYQKYTLCTYVMIWKVPYICIIHICVCVCVCVWNNCHPCNIFLWTSNRFEKSSTHFYNVFFFITALFNEWPSIAVPSLLESNSAAFTMRHLPELPRKLFQVVLKTSYVLGIPSTSLISIVQS